MQTLAYSAAEDEHTSSCIYQGEEGPVLNVEAGDSVLMRDKFELVADGLDLLAEQYPENVNFKKAASAARRWTCSCLRRAAVTVQRLLAVMAPPPAAAEKGGVCSRPGQRPGGCCRRGG